MNDDFHDKLSGFHREIVLPNRINDSSEGFFDPKT